MSRTACLVIVALMSATSAFAQFREFGDRVRVAPGTACPTSFSIYPPGAYGVYCDGQSFETNSATAELRFHIGYVAGASGDPVEYRIYSETAGFDTGVKTSVIPGPGSTVSISAQWNVRNGTFTFTVILDPSNKLQESITGRLNNKATLTVGVTAWEVRRVRLSDFQPIVQPSLLSSRVIDDPSGFCSSSVTFDELYEEADIQLNYAGTTGYLYYPCKVVFELFRNATVGNGWTFYNHKVIGLSTSYTAVQTPAAASIHSIFQGWIQMLGAPTTAQTSWSVTTYVRGIRGTKPSFGPYLKLQ